MRVYRPYCAPAFASSMATAAGVSIEKVEILGVTEARRTLAFNQQPSRSSDISEFARRLTDTGLELDMRGKKVEVVQKPGGAETGLLERGLVGRRAGSVAVETLVTGNQKHMQAQQTHIFVTYDMIMCARLVAHVFVCACQAKFSTPGAMTN